MDDRISKTGLQKQLTEDKVNSQKKINTIYCSATGPTAVLKVAAGLINRLQGR